MLTNSVIIVLREVLEAALIISVFLALGQKLNQSKTWLFSGLSLGIISAIIYAINIQSVSMAWEGLGQEILNAGIQFLLYLDISLFVVLLKYRDITHLISWVMACCIVLAITREGSEIIIYIQGLTTIPEMRSPVLIGSVIGAGIGISVGVFCYYLIANISFNNGMKLGLFLLVLIAAGMVLQVTQLLIQADIINSQQALWNSSSLISERSLLGQLLYALIGYEATPTPLQVYAYITSLIIMIILTVTTLKHLKQRESL